MDREGLAGSTFAARGVHGVTASQRDETLRRAEETPG
jgi:hypothetical protein